MPSNLLISRKISTHIRLPKSAMDNLTLDKLVCFEDFFLILYIGRTRIVQVTANHAADAPIVRIIEMLIKLQMLTQAPADEQPILVMVKRKYCCCCFDLKLDVPTSLTVLEENCGKSTGIMQPGAQWCYCCNRRIACMLTKAIVNYNAPVIY